MAITYTDNGGGAPNGSDLEFTYTFPVIQTEDVKVALNGVTQATTKYAVDNVSNPTKITFNNTSVDSSVQESSGAPKSGVRVRVYRETTVGKTNGDENPKAVFAAGSSIRAIDLNANQEQSLMAIHELQDRPIETEDIQNDAITNVKIADDQIDSEHYVAGSIDLEHMSANSVDSDQYVDGSIDHIHLSNDCVDGDNIQDDSINSEHYVDRSIDTQHIGGSQVTTNELATNAVTTIKITDGNVTTAKIANSAVTSDKIADGAVVGAKIAANVISNSKMMNDSITQNEIADNAVVTAGIADNAVTGAKIADGSITSDKLNAATVITSSEQGSATTNDTSFLTSAAADARFFNISSGDTIKDGQSFPDNDTTIATTAAINDRIIDIVNDVGGFDIIDSEQHFPNTNPQGQAGSAAVLSIKTASAALPHPSDANISSLSGTTLTIKNGNLANNADITITGVTATIPSGFGFIVESTGTTHTYTFHRLVPKATEVTTVAGVASNVTTVAGISSNVTTVAGISSNVTAVAGNATNINSVASIASNINAVAADASDIGIVAADGTDIGLVAGSITNVNNVGGSIANVNTVASNLSGVNSFADRYRVDSTAPNTNLDAGDLYFDTSSNELRVYNGSAWQGGVTATGNLAGTGANTFTGNQTIQSTEPKLILTDTNNNPDFEIRNANGYFKITDSTNSADRLNIDNSGNGNFPGNFDIGSGLDVTGNITVTGNVDGRDVAADGASLDNIEAGNIGTDVTNGNIKLSPNGTGVVEVRGAGGADGTLQLNCSAQSHGIKLKSPPHSAAQSYTLTFPSSIVNNGFLKTDSSGNLSFAAVNTDLVNDTSPQLGGDLDSNGQNITWLDSSGSNNNRALFGAGNDLQIYHSGNHSFIQEVGTGSLYIDSNQLYLRQANDGTVLLYTTSGGEVRIQHNGNDRIRTDSTGVTLTGDFLPEATDTRDLGSNSKKWSELYLKHYLYMPDDGRIRLGSNYDMQLWHDGSHQILLGKTGNTYVTCPSGQSIRLNKSSADNFNAEQMVTAYTDGAVELYYDNSKKLETVSTGTQIVGDLTFSGATSKAIRLGDNNRIYFGAGEDAWIGSNGSNGEVSGSLFYYNNQHYYDGVRIRMGNAQDLEFYHVAGQDSYVDSNSGQLYIRSNQNIYIQPNDSENGLVCIANGTVRLYYDNAEKIATTSNGVEVQGRYAFNSNNYITCNTSANTMEFVTNSTDIGEFSPSGLMLRDNMQLRLGTGNDLRLYHDGGDNHIDSVNSSHKLKIRSEANIELGRAGANELMGVFSPNGSVSLYYDNSKKIETTSSGIDVTGAITVNGSALGSGGLISTDSDSGYLTSGDQSLSSSYTEIMELQITPSSSSNKVAILSSMVIQTNGNNSWGGPAANHKVTRTVGGTTTTLIDQNILYQRDNIYAHKYLMAPSSIDYMDSPNTTSQVTYKIYAKYSDTAGSGSIKSYNSIAMEVAV